MSELQATEIQPNSIPSGQPRLSTRKQFIILALMNLVFGVSILCLGLAAFTFTADYRAGSFWTAFLLLVSFIYNTSWLGARLIWNDNTFIKKHSRKLGALSAIISIVAFTGCLVAAIIDTVAYILLSTTDFSQCEYTNHTTTESCSNPACPTLELSPRTCYCCYLYNDRTAGGCDTPFLLGKQTTFSQVSSCEAISGVLQPILGTLCGLNVGAAIICVVYFFQTSPLRYLVKNKDQKSEQENIATAEANNHTKMMLVTKLKVFLCNMFCRVRISEQTEKSEPKNFNDEVVQTT